jgi:hypothetical protein
MKKSRIREGLPILLVIKKGCRKKFSGSLFVSYDASTVFMEVFFFGRSFSVMVSPVNP